MANHCPRITQTKIYVDIAIDVSNRPACGIGRYDRKWTRPTFHPWHGHPRKEGTCAVLRLIFGLGMTLFKQIDFLVQQFRQTRKQHEYILIDDEVQTELLH